MLPASLQRLDDECLSCTGLLRSLPNLKHLGGALTSTQVVELGEGLSGLTYLGRLFHKCVDDTATPTGEGSTASPSGGGSRRSRGRRSRGVSRRRSRGVSGGAQATPQRASSPDGGLGRLVDVATAASFQGALRKLYLSANTTSGGEHAVVYGPSFVRRLQHLPNLEVLQAGEFQLDAAAVAELTGLSALTLNLSSCKLDSSALQVLPAALAQLPRLQPLSLPDA